MATLEYTYPLALPSAPAPRNSTIELERVVGIAASTFTRAQQVQRHQGAQWRLSFEYPPMRRAEAAEWQAFFAKLQGIYGTFLAGDPDAKTIRGSLTGSPLVDGASQTGNQINVDGLPETTAGLLLPGDYISFASYNHMHMVTASLDSDSSGSGTITFEPSLRSSPGNNAALQFANVTGAFRLTENVGRWSANEMGIYGFSLEAMEAI